MRKLYFIVASLLICSCSKGEDITTAPEQFPDYGEVLAFPGAEGHGKYAIGGRYGSVYHVTNLKDSGKGSFRDAVSQPNRIIVFDVSGVIQLKSRVNCSKNLTIAAQTAPGDGVVLYGADVCFSGADNMICRYLRIRMGINGTESDAAGVASGSNMIFDHMSVTWGRDECFSVNADPAKPNDPPRNITIQNSFMGQGLQPHSCGGLMQTFKYGITLYRNYYFDNKTRNPKAWGLNQYINNVVYNWGNGGAYIMAAEAGRLSSADIQNNYFIVGPTNNYDGNVLGSTPPFSRYNAYFSAFLSGNYYDDNKDGVLNGRELTREDCITHTNEGGVDVTYSPTFLEEPNPAHPKIEGMTSAEEAYEWIVQYGGASLPARDEVDTYIIEELKTLGGRGNILSSEMELPMQGPGNLKSGERLPDTDNDGMPDEFEDKYGLNKKDPSDAMKIAKNGYTNIENYIFLIK